MKSGLKITLAVLVIITILGLWVTGCGETTPATTPTTSEKYVCNFQSHMPLDNTNFVSVQNWANVVEEATGGRVEFKYYPTNQLAPMPEAFNALGSGVFEGLLAIPPMSAGSNALNMAPEMPFVQESFEQASDLWWNKGWREVIDGAFQKSHNSKITYVCFNPTNSLWSKTPVRTLDDVSKIMWGATGVPNNIIIEALGGECAVIPTADSYLALQRGTVDGYFLGYNAMVNYAYHEVVHYYLMPACGGGGMLISFNLDFWNDLPSDIQAIIMATGKEATQIYWLDIQKQVAELDKLAAEKGVTVITLSDDEVKRWQTACDAVWDWYFDRCDEQGFGAEARQLKSILDKQRRES